MWEGQLTCVGQYFHPIVIQSLQPIEVQERVSAAVRCVCGWMDGVIYREIGERVYVCVTYGVQEVL